MYVHIYKCCSPTSYVQYVCTTANNSYYYTLYVLRTSLHREWLEGVPALIDTAVFTYISILPSHSAQSLASLRQQETSFCLSMIRAKVVYSVQHLWNSSIPDPRVELSKQDTFSHEIYILGSEMYC